MRLSFLFLLPLAAGCAGNLADYIGERGSIVSPQLLRYGFDLAQARCVGERLGASLRPLQLRLLVRSAGALRSGYFEPGRLTPRDFGHVAAAMADPGVRPALGAALDACGMADALRPPPAPVAEIAVPAPRGPTWLNLGTAGSGQAIAIDAATIDQQGATRTAWFRLTDPGAAPSNDAYLLLIDCAARTINAKTRERRDANGTVLERIDYRDNPLPVEGGTVMEIAFLSMCT